jgi:iron complex transport system substrate-binding protein
MRKVKKVVAIIVATITVATTAGCGSQSASVPNIDSAKSLGVQVNETTDAKRVIALANGSAEIISALGFKSLIIGRDIASTDADLKSIPIVTSGHQVVAEKIIALRPDVVIIDRSTGPEVALATLRKAGISVITIPEAWTLTDIPAKISSVAAAIGTPRSGEVLVKQFEQSLPRQLREKKKVRIAFLYLRGGSAIYLVGGKESGADSLIAAIGATDVGAAKFSQPFTAMTSELMVALNPDLILVMSKGLESVGGVEGLVALPGVAQTAAGKAKRVISVDDSLLLSFGPRTPDLITQLSKAVEKVSQR